MKEQWTLGTLKIYVERILEERQVALGAALASADKAVLAAFQASKEAITKAESAQNSHNATSNNFRGTLADQAKLFIPKQEAESRLEQLRELIERNTKDIVELQKFESRGEGSTHTQTSYRNLLLAIVGLAVTVLLAGAGGIGTLVFYLVTRP